MKLDSETNVAAGNLKMLEAGTQKINAYGADVSCGIGRSETAQTKFQNRLIEPMLRLLPCYSSPFGGGQIAKPKSNSATNDIPMISLTNRVKLVKNPLTNAATYAQPVNERVFCAYAGPHTEKSARKPQEAMSRQSQSCFVSFPGINNNTQNNKTDTQNNKTDPQPNRQFLKKVSREPNGQNSFSQISDDFRDKFPNIFIGSKHRGSLSRASSNVNLPVSQRYSGILHPSSVFFGGIIAHNTCLNGSVGIVDKKMEINSLLRQINSMIGYLK